MKKKVFKGIRFVLLLQIIVVLGIGYMKFKPLVRPYLDSRFGNIKKTEQISEGAEIIESLEQDLEGTDSIVDESIFSKDEELPKPLTTESIVLKDIFTFPGEEISFVCYEKEAIDYYWETYNSDKRCWEEEVSVLETDELFREVSCIKRTAGEEMLVRCTISMAAGDKKEEQAKIHLLSKEVKELELGDCSGNAGSFLSTLEIPVTVTYADGIKQNIKGLYGLFFCIPKGRDIAVEKNQTDGNTVEIIRTTTKEYQYKYLEIGEYQENLRLRGNDRVYELYCNIQGEDSGKPEILEVILGNYEITQRDIAQKVTVTINAEDSYSPITALEYAFLPETKVIEESDWRKENQFEAEISQNGNWIAYARDEAGNYATSHKEIILVDQKAPSIISVAVEHPDGWVKNNKILVEAKDATDLLYRFRNESTDSEWISYNHFLADKNGIWNISVKDSAGNISSQEIEILNIDTENPIIQVIDELE